MRVLHVPLMLLCATFVALAAWPWLPLDAAGPAPAIRPPGAVGVVAEAELAMPPLDSFRATVERPLFVATRSPARPVEAAGPDLILGRYRLTGVMIASERTTVLLRPATGGKVIRLEQGQELDGWKVVTITPDHIVLTTAGREQRIPLGGAPRAPEPGRGR